VNTRCIRKYFEVKNLTRVHRYKLGLVKLGLKQKDLAEILNVSESYLSQLMSCERQNKAFQKWMDENVLCNFSSRGNWNAK
jgi:transcriptional regulator with XRE-family HTH domain